MGAYLNHSKVGWSLFAFGNAGDYPGELLNSLGEFEVFAQAGLPIVVSRSELEIRAYGAPTRMDWEMKAVLNPDLSLHRFQFRLDGKDSRIFLQGQTDGGKMTVQVRSASVESVETLADSVGNIYIAESLPLLMSEWIKKGEPIDREVTIFEPHQLTCSTWRIEADGIEALRVGDRSVETYRIRQEIGGFSPLLWMDGEGRVYKEWAPFSDQLGYLSFSETEQQAKDRTFLHPLLSASLVHLASDSEETDLLYATSVQVPDRIPQSHRINRMVIDLWNFELERPMPEGKWQSNLARYQNLAPKAELPLRLEIHSPRVEMESGPTISYSLDQLPEAIRPLLEGESLIQVDHPRIRELATEITQGVESPWEKSVAIYHWIEKNIRTEFRITLPSALEVLETGKGDCNEQSTLFAALARAAGVPAKICTGLVYQDDGFYYHAWNEVLVSVAPEIWVPIDTALKQIHTDATHIKFGEGGLSNQTYLNNLIGKIRARIVEFDTDDTDRKPDQAFRNQDSG